MYACTYGRDSFTSSFLTCKPFISFLALLCWPGFSTLCWIRVVRGDRHPCLFPILGESVQSSISKYNVSCRLFVMVLIKLRKFLIFWVVFFFSHACVLNFFKCFSKILWSCEISPLGYLHVLHWFLNTESALILYLLTNVPHKHR